MVDPNGGGSKPYCLGHLVLGVSGVGFRACLGFRV